MPFILDNAQEQFLLFITESSEGLPFFFPPLSSGDCSKTLESLIRMKICFIAQESQQYSSLEEMLRAQTQLSVLPSALSSSHHSPMCYAYVSPFLAPRK